MDFALVSLLIVWFVYFHLVSMSLFMFLIFIFSMWPIPAIFPFPKFPSSFMDLPISLLIVCFVVFACNFSGLYPFLIFILHMWSILTIIAIYLCPFLPRFSRVFSSCGCFNEISMCVLCFSAFILSIWNIFTIYSYSLSLPLDFPHDQYLIFFKPHSYIHAHTCLY